MMRKIEQVGWKDNPQLQKFNKVLEKTNLSLEEIFGIFPHAEEKIAAMILRALEKQQPETVADLVTDFFEDAREAKNSDFFKKLGAAVEAKNHDEMRKILLEEWLRRKSDREGVVAVNTDEERAQLTQENWEGVKGSVKFLRRAVWQLQFLQNRQEAPTKK